ncbi:Rap1a/Tai family immunity protein [Sinorhizobium americanum]|uniref:Rap1a immunity protein domain-containing protein n=1 Tax=Sinorhizobium americanum TaxID=194963 RepID=A0A4R2BZB6_9HYPH|nr:Rap1a/Tai family immunity protein [Sinorhizobium americanum]TCN32473.1 hypothetical protein EV184_104139 [Sinorhizobium americanum]
MIRIVAAILGFAFASPAAAQFYTGNKLHELCEKRNGISLGYAVAVSDWVMTEMRKDACIPDKVTTGQLHDIICGFLTNHPEARHDPAHFLGARALIEAFPCNK